jgi:hypothetical protein
MPADATLGDAKTALRAAIGRDAVQLSLEQISTRNLPAATPALMRNRDITIADHDPTPRRSAYHYLGLIFRPASDLEDPNGFGVATRSD